MTKLKRPASAVRSRLWPPYQSLTDPRNHGYVPKRSNCASGLSQGLELHGDDMGGTPCTWSGSAVWGPRTSIWVIIGVFMSEQRFRTECRLLLALHEIRRTQRKIRLISNASVLALIIALIFIYHQLTNRPPTPPTVYAHFTMPSEE